MEALIPIIIQLISGVAGGGVVGSMLKNEAMSMLPKLLAGGVGGLGGGAALAGPIASMLGGDASGLDLASIIGNVGGGLVGGGALTGIAGALMGAMKK